MTDSESKRTEYLRANMSLGEQLDDLARRVAEIELGLSASKPTGAHVCPMELARLRRIEEAARRVYSWNWQYTAGIDRQAERDLESLRAALDSEPKR